MLAINSKTLNDRLTSEISYKKIVKRLIQDYYSIVIGLKSDGHGNGGTLINGNGGTHYRLSIHCKQPLFIIIPVVYIN